MVNYSYSSRRPLARNTEFPCKHRINIHLAQRDDEFLVPDDLLRPEHVAEKCDMNMLVEPKQSTLNNDKLLGPTRDIRTFTEECNAKLPYERLRAGYSKILRRIRGARWLTKTYARSLGVTAHTPTSRTVVIPAQAPELDANDPSSEI